MVGAWLRGKGVLGAWLRGEGVVGAWLRGEGVVGAWLQGEGVVGASVPAVVGMCTAGRYKWPLNRLILSGASLRILFPWALRIGGGSDDLEG